MSTKATSRTTKAPPRRETLKPITTTARSKTSPSKLYIKYIFKSTRFFNKMLCRYFGHVFCHSWLRVDSPASHWRKGRLLLVPLLHRGLPTHPKLHPSPPSITQGPPCHLPHSSCKSHGSHLRRQRQRMALLLPCAECNRQPVGGKRDGFAGSCKGQPCCCYSRMCWSLRDRRRRDIDGNDGVSSHWKPQVGTRTSTPCRHVSSMCCHHLPHKLPGHLRVGDKRV